MSAALPNAAVASLAYDRGGVAHVAYYDSADSSLKYETLGANGIWSTAVVIDSHPLSGTQLSLAIDSTGQPGIAYYDAANGDLKYAHHNKSPIQSAQTGCPPPPPESPPQ